MKKILLIIPEHFYVNNNTGITLQSIFQLYDKSKLGEIVFSSDKESNKLPFSFSFPQRKAGNHLSNFIYILRTIYSKELNNFVKNYNPDIIYFICSTFQGLITTKYLIKKYRIPCIVHYYDNIRQTAKFNYLYNYYCKGIEKYAKCGLVISEEMKKAYEKKYHCIYEVLMNAIPDDMQPSQKVHGIVRTFIYAGGLHLNRALPLKDIAVCLDEQSHIDGNNYHFGVFTPDYQKHGHDFDGTIVELHAGLPHNEILEVYKTSDVLVHVEPFNKEMFAFLKYSLTTKLPEYLISGKAILCYAPEESAVLRFIRENNLGYTATNINELKTCLKLLCGGSSKTDEYIVNSIEIAKERFTERKAFEKLTNVIDQNLNDLSRKRL